jgi:D-sedoheptulose 7-phosphate isomerase
VSDAGAERIGYLERYLAAGADTLRRLPVAALDGIVDVLVRALETDRWIYVMGNGGSAANAEHFVNDLGKGGRGGFPRRFKVLSLASNVPLLTAWANDTAYDQIFAEQLRNFVGPGDVVIALSGSGNSPSVLNALALARARGAVTVGFTGGDGGKLRALCDHCVVVPDESMQHIEEGHLAALHAIYSAIRDFSMPPEPGSAEPSGEGR